MGIGRFIWGLRFATDRPGRMLARAWQHVADHGRLAVHV